MDGSVVTVETVYDEVYSRLRTGITSGVIAPGGKMSIRSIADRLGVSTMPVREALKRLESDGLVVFHRRSVTVAALSAKEVEQIFDIRWRLEGLASEWAISKVTDRDIAELDAILSSMERADIEPLQWRLRNQQFHLRFYECAGSAHLLELIHKVWDKVEPYMAIYATNVESFDQARREHRELLALIAERDPPRLLDATERHLADTRTVVLAALSA
ncbi:GntR family transcriptional regulator [Saccharopolyspora sp. K220]|uniref:GntR family transcriptional regulator n=1 Tax=Saccharopolyspora soli TaxID=2926618 RepID=UPI001F55BC16|nr:GntR family transcriptional regulator [Saccharopolyspora soli]MCI2422321.1 GntR family transcriptional regulator [Saccharopolyspora soli]